MADENISSQGNQIVIKGHNPNYIVERKITHASTMYPGMAVTNKGESNNNGIDLASAGEGVLGILLEHVADDQLAGTNRDPLDIDTVYANGSTARVALLGSGMTCLVFLAGQTTTTTIYGGEDLAVSATAGQLAISTFNSTDLISHCGKCIVYNTGGSSRRVISAII